MNSVDSVFRNPFKNMRLEDKLRIKELGADQPALPGCISRQTTLKGKTYTRHFMSTWYEKKSWLCGCPIRNAVFCFPCILFGGGHSQSDSAWTTRGMTDMKHFSERVKKHEIGKAHMEASLKLAMLGRANIARQLDHDYHAGILRHNLQVDHNRQTLSKLIDCVKFCGAFELALRGQDETESLENPGVFRGLVDFVSKLDIAMKEHLEKATVFKGSAKAIQNELLDCMQDVMQGHIIQDLQNAHFVSLQADETTDISTHCQLVVVYRYVDACSAVQERFFSLFKMEEGNTADAIGSVLLENLRLIFPPDADKAKLVSQTYDGASVMRGVTGGVRKMIQDVYPNAHFLHCYAHSLNLVMQKAASAVPQARVFFSDLSGFTSFFSRSPKRTKVFDDTVARRQPHAPQTPRNFHFRLVNTVHEHVADLLECFQTIQYSSHFDEITIREAKGFIRMLEDTEFLFFLELFSQIMPCVDILFAKLQLRSIDAAKAQNATKVFIHVMAKIRESVPDLCEKFTATQSRGGHHARKLQAYQVCDIISANAHDRFTFTEHLTAATLLQSDQFAQHAACFPLTTLKRTVAAYPMLDQGRLQTELSLIYDNEDFRSCMSVTSLLKVITDNKLQEVFSETVKLTRILITIPMTTVESERCFSTLRRIKTFLRNTMSQDTEDRLNALAMLSIEKKLTWDIPEFNRKTIEKFAELKNHREKFIYK